MDVKTYTARTMAQALQVVRSRLGANAVVLHTRTYKRGGILGIGAKSVVEVTAADGRQVGRESQGKRANPAGSTRRGGGRPRSRSALPPGRRVGAASTSKTASGYSPSTSGPSASAASGHSSRDASQSDALAGDLIRKTYQAAQAEMQARHPGGVNPATTSGRASSNASPAQATGQSQSRFASPPGTDAASFSSSVNGRPTSAQGENAQFGRAHQSAQVAAQLSTGGQSQTNPLWSNPDIANVQPLSAGSGDQLGDEMRAVRQLVARLMHEQTRQNGELPQHSSRDQLFQQYMSLIEQEMAEELAGEIVEKVRTDHADLDCEDTAACRSAVSEVIAQHLVTDDDAGHYQPTEDGRPRTLALVGPTGVGKTTTVAKLAADFKLKQDRRVGLLTLDTYRIAAVDQLKTYAGIIGVPLEVVSNLEQVKPALDRLSDREIILIDTAGRSQKDSRRLDELARWIDAAKPHETHLVLSSTSTQKVLFETVERFSKIHTDRVLFTKLDEAVTFGTLVTVARKVNKKLSYLTTGQEVPHHIEPGRSKRLASLVVGETALRQGGES